MYNARGSFPTTRSELLYPILLRLPLNVIWRLPGLNKQFNKLLEKELLWKLKCEFEFPVLHTRIPNYRHYWLIRTTNYYGRLFDNNKEDHRYQRVRAMSEIGSYSDAHDIFLLNKDELIRYQEPEDEAESELVASGVNLLEGEMYRDRNGNNHLIKYHGRYGFEGTKPLQSGYGELVSYHNDGTKYQLTTKGVLHIDDEDGEREITDVIDYNFDGYLLLVLKTDGTVMIKDFHSGGRDVLPGKYIKMIGTSLYRFDGKLITVHNVADGFTTKMVNLTVPGTIRYYDGTVIGTTDGTCYTNDKTVLNPELVYRDFLFREDNLYVARAIRPQRFNNNCS